MRVPPPFAVDVREAARMAGLESSSSEEEDSDDDDDDDDGFSDKEVGHDYEVCVRARA